MSLSLSTAEGNKTKSQELLDSYLKSACRFLDDKTAKGARKFAKNFVRSDDRNFNAHYGKPATKDLLTGIPSEAGRGMPVEQNNQRLHIRRPKVYRNQECYADPTAGEALARIAREEQLHAQAKRFREIKYKLAWTNPAFLCSADHGRDCIGYQKNLQCKR